MESRQHGKKGFAHHFRLVLQGHSSARLTENQLIGDCTRICMSNPYCLCTIQERSKPFALSARGYCRAAIQNELDGPPVMFQERR